MHCVCACEFVRDVCLKALYIIQRKSKLTPHNSNLDIIFAFGKTMVGPSFEEKLMFLLKDIGIFNVKCENWSERRCADGV